MLRNKAAVSDIKGLHRAEVPLGAREPTTSWAPATAARSPGSRCAAARSITTCWRASRDKRDDVAIVRIEQLYPLPPRRLGRTLARVPRRKGVLLGAGGAGQSGCLADVRPGAAKLLPDRLTGIKRISRRAMSAPSSFLEGARRGDPGDPRRGRSADFSGEGACRSADTPLRAYFCAPSRVSTVGCRRDSAAGCRAAGSATGR